MRVMIRYPGDEYGYAEYDNEVFMMGGKPYTAEDIRNSNGIVTASDPDVRAEMERIGAPVQGVSKPRILSVSLSEYAYNAVRDSAKECGVKVSQIAEWMLRVPAENPTGYMEYVRVCQRRGLSPEKLLMQMVEQKTAELR